MVYLVILPWSLILAQFLKEKQTNKKTLGTYHAHFYTLQVPLEQQVCFWIFCSEVMRRYSVGEISGENITVEEYSPVLAKLYQLLMT